MRHLCALALVASTAACAATVRDVARPAATVPAEVSSNVLREDYAGSSACARCHEAESAGWAASPMHRMTRVLPGAEVAAPFDGTVFRFKDDRLTLSRKGEQRFMEMRTAEGTHTFRMTRVIGGNHREDFAGIDVERGGDEQIMPVSWLRWSKKLRYKGYSVMSHERPGLRAGPAWSETCIFCHNTEPYVLDLLGAMAAPLVTKRPPGYQGAYVDALLPEPRRWKYVVTDAPALERALGAEMEHIGAGRPAGDARELLLGSIAATRGAFDAKDLIEVGIGCESCHGGSAAHARDPRTMPSLMPRASFLSVEGPPKDPTRARVAAIDRTCARCHQVLFSRYPHTWEGGDRTSSPGGSHINSGEARDFLLGGCTSALACTACHDPHGKGTGAIAAKLETRAGDAVCTGCHAKYATDDALRAHAHHAPEGAGGRCVSCHMPKKNMSLDSGLGRYHHIASPTDPNKVLRDRPLECALCHADHTVGVLVGAMERWWGKSYERAALAGLYGDLERPAMAATLERGKPHEKAVALYLLGEARDKRSAGAFARELVGPYPLVRGYAEGALEKLLGEPSPIDPGATDEEIERAASAWLGRHGLP